MPKVRVSVDLEEDTYRAYSDEAERRGITVEYLVEEVANRLMRELVAEQREGVDHPIIPS